MGGVESGERFVERDHRDGGTESIGGEDVSVSDVSDVGPVEEVVVVSDLPSGLLVGENRSESRDELTVAGSVSIERRERG